MIVNETIYFITEIIRVDILIGFGLYSIILFLLRYFLKNKQLFINFDITAVRTTAISGIAFGILFLISTVLAYYQIENEFERYAFQQRITGPYGFANWLAPLVLMIFSQLLWIKKISKHFIFRTIIWLILILNIEQVVIFITSLYRDYLPSSWVMYPYWNFGDIIIHLITKIILFIAIVAIFHFSILQLKKRN